MSCSRLKCNIKKQTDGQTVEKYFKKLDNFAFIGSSSMDFRILLVYSGNFVEMISVELIVINESVRKSPLT